MGYRIGIDVGGTFTDFVAVNTDQQMYSGKTPTIAADEAAQRLWRAGADCGPLWRLSSDAPGRN